LAAIRAYRWFGHLFLFACAPYIFIMGSLSQVRCCDPDEGLSGYFRRDEWGLEEPGFVFTIILLWTLLGFLLLPPVMRRGSSGHATWWDPFGALFLFPLSLFTTVLAIDVYYRYHGWVIAVPILLPTVITENIVIDLPDERSQLKMRIGALRHKHLYTQIQAAKQVQRPT
jgi:hypothetical protein